MAEEVGEVEESEWEEVNFWFMVENWAKKSWKIGRRAGRQAQMMPAQGSIMDHAIGIAVSSVETNKNRLAVKARKG